MREIKFRARRKKMVWITMYTKYKYEPGEMVYGNLLDLGGDDIYIVIPNDYEEDREYKEAHKEAEYIPVYRETVGQYTGLKDKNGKEIYEGDILYDSNLIKSIEAYSEVIWDLEMGRFDAWGRNLWVRCSKTEVIGNVWEHPHLLEGKDEA